MSIDSTLASTSSVSSSSPSLSTSSSSSSSTSIPSSTSLSGEIHNRDTSPFSSSKRQKTDTNDGLAGTNKIFVGGLHYNTRKPGLMQYFGQFGSIHSAQVVMKDLNKTRGFGFVTFDDPASVDRTLQQRMHVVDGKATEVKRATPKTDAASDAKGREKFVKLLGAPKIEVLGGGAMTHSYTGRTINGAPQTNSQGYTPKYPNPVGGIIDIQKKEREKKSLEYASKYPNPIGGIVDLSMPPLPVLPSVTGTAEEVKAKAEVMSRVDKKGRLHVPPGVHSVSNAVKDAKEQDINCLWLENGVHDEKGEIVGFGYPLKLIVGESCEKCIVIGGLKMIEKAGYKYNADVKDVTLRGLKSGVVGGNGATIHLDNVRVEKGGGRSVRVYGSANHTMISHKCTHKCMEEL